MGNNVEKLKNYNKEMKVIISVKTIDQQSSENGWLWVNINFLTILLKWVLSNISQYLNLLQV